MVDPYIHCKQNHARKVAFCDIAHKHSCPPRMSPLGNILKYIEDICFFEVNTKYISLSELKTSEFSRVRSTSENYYVFNSRDEIYLVFTEKKQIFFLFYTMYRHFPMHKVGGENAKTKFF